MVQTVEARPEAIRTSIQNQLAWDSRVNSKDLRVEVSGGIARLTGTVTNYNAKRYAASDALLTPGVKEIDNRITVKYPGYVPVPPDSVIQSNIKQLFQWNSNLDASKLDVSVKDGWVTLRGSVDRYWEKIRAEELAAGVPGVLELTNEIAVVPRETLTDKQIAEDVISALNRMIDVNMNQVNVQVDNGVVKLEGLAQDMTTYRTIEDIAFYTKGVTSVNNKMLIAPKSGV